MENKPKYIIGIDPDINKSGVAILDVNAKMFYPVQALTFMELATKLSMIKVDHEFPITKDNCIVVIEDSDNRTNWHLEGKHTPRVAAAIGHNTGMCHAVQRLIEEAADWFGFKIALQRPFKKTWMGRDGKITQEEIRQFIPTLPERMNQECRDAALLAWCYAGLPIQIPASFYQKQAIQELRDKTAKEGEFLLKDKGVKPDENGRYHSEGIMSQIDQWYEKARQKAQQKITLKELNSLSQEIAKRDDSHTEES